MEPQKITMQMMEFNKKLFDNAFDAVTSLQDQTEKLVADFMEKASWFPAEGKKAVSEWLKTYKKGRDEFKKSADDNYKKSWDYISKAGKEETPKITKK